MLKSSHSKYSISRGENAIWAVGEESHVLCGSCGPKGQVLRSPIPVFYRSLIISGERLWTVVKEISAGGVVFHRRNGRTEILLIKDRYSRWTLPKGKMEKGETAEETALREIREETGVEGRILRPLTTIHYRYEHPDLGNMEKKVHYYLVEAVSETLIPALSEIGGARWFSPDEAWRLMQREGYDNNLPVLEEACRQLGLVLEEKP